MAPSNKKAVPSPAPATKAQEKQVNAPPMTTAAPVTETKDLAAATAPSPLAVLQAPAWLQKHMQGQAKPRGLELVDKADIIMPRLVLAQAQSPEVAKPEHKALGISVGDIFDNISKRIYAKQGEPLRAIPVVLGKSRFYLGDYEKGEGILCRADDAITARAGGKGKDQGGQPTVSCEKCVFKEWDEEAGHPECSLFYNVVMLLPDFGMAAIVWSLKHTGVKVAKRFLSVANQVNADFFSKVYLISTKTESNDRFSFQNFDFQMAPGWVSEEQYNYARAFYERLKGGTWAADTTDLANEATGDAATAPAREPGSDDDEVPSTDGVPPSPPSAQEDDGF